MRLRRVTIERFRAIKELSFDPGARTVILGPQNAGKSTVLEALDLLLHHGIGRPRPAPTEIDYFARDPTSEFAIEAVIGELSESFLAGVNRYLEGWKEEDATVVPEPDGDGIEPVVRVRVLGTPDFDLVHEFSKPEAEGARFGRAFRSQIGWVFDGRQRDPARQLAFYQGGMLDRLFGGEAELADAVTALKAALGAGASAVNDDENVNAVLEGLGNDLLRLGLVGGGEQPTFEVGAVSQRELLQSLRLALPSDGVAVPLFRQGRGAQRLLLVSVLLRLAKEGGSTPIGGFEEPEEALEPLRQSQLAEMLIRLAADGSQVFVVTHSPEIARSFEIDDFLLLHERASGANARALRRVLSPPVRQTYERWLDGAVVRGLFCRVPVLVEGPGDRAALSTFWAAMAATERVRPAAQLGLDFVNCESFTNMAMLAAVLDEAGKSVVAWVEQDQGNVREEVERIRAEAHAAALVSHELDEGRQNLEQALVAEVDIDHLCESLETIAVDRGYPWEQQREALITHLSSVTDVDPEARERAKATTCVAEFLHCFEEQIIRATAVAALSAKGVRPFEMKGARQARLMAETLVLLGGVPANFASAIERLAVWIESGCPVGTEITMGANGASA